MVCMCGCKTEFEPTRPGQRYLDPQHRYRAHNRRRPARRSNALPVAASDALDEPQQACYRAVAGPSGPIGAQTPEGPQILAASAFSEFQILDQIIQREKLLTPREVAAVLGVSINTLRSWRGKRWRKDLPYVKLAGQHTRYRLRDLRAWLDRLGVATREAIKEAR